MSTATLTRETPKIQRHQWQALGCMVSSFRPDWDLEDIMQSLWDARDKQTFPELAQTALAVAMDPSWIAPCAIYFVAAGVYQL